MYVCDLFLLSVVHIGTKQTEHTESCHSHVHERENVVFDFQSLPNHSIKKCMLQFKIYWLQRMHLNVKIGRSVGVSYALLTTVDIVCNQELKRRKENAI